MEKPKSLDALDRGILRILPPYKHLNLLEVWFEIGEAGTLEPMTKGEVLSRLQSLVAQGFVERVTLGNEDIRWALKRIKRS